MRRRDVGWLVGYGVALIFATWVATAISVSAGWLLPPGPGVPVHYELP